MPHKDSKFCNLLMKAFLSTNTPLYRLNNADMTELFDYCGFSLPSVTQMRHLLKSELARKNHDILCSFFKEKDIFLVVDESEINKKKYVNILADDILTPKVNYILDVIQLDDLISLNSKLLSQLIKEVLDKYNIKLIQIKLIMSDAARYMIKTIELLRESESNFYHGTCLAHLIHNCAMIIRAKFANVDKLIATAKAITVKNKNNKARFNLIGVPPSVIVTRWSSWLKAVLYYCNNFFEVKEIVNSIEEDGILIQRAREAICDVNLMRDLIKIKNNYEGLKGVLDSLENNRLTVEERITLVRNFSFSDDVAHIHKYISARLQKK